MSRYQIVKKKREGYYEIYTVQEGKLLFFWTDLRSFNTLTEAKQWIKDQKVIQVTSAVHEE